MPLGWLGMVAAPLGQIFAVTTLAIASHVPCSILALKVAAANPGEPSQPGLDVRIALCIASDCLA